MKQDLIRMDTQTVLIGLGGTGSRVVNNVAMLLRKNSIAINDGKVTCAVMDTNQNDNTNITDSGTDIPVIPTCDERKIREYLALYANKDTKNWCTSDETFGDESMIDGASEIRIKSRIAFMDTMSTGKIQELENAIEKVFHNKSGKPEKLRVMLVSSLAGGTGSGMFIQVALWLRQFFEKRNCEATIRGILLLPDVFLRTIPNAKNNARKKLYYYANAYAAIRELNAINKVVRKNFLPERPIIIQDLFDSRKPGVRQVFDNAFFIDDVDKGGAAFTSIGEYEKIVAQIVYMQLYAPMYSELYSVEDNLFRAFNSSKEPVYGSCGTSKAEYPRDVVTEYCALRAAKDSVNEGWNRIDAEIDALEEEAKLAEKDGLDPKPVSRRDKFIEIFDEKTAKTDHVGKEDRLFVSIRNDIFNETREPSADGSEMIVIPSCKIEGFVSLLDNAVSASVEANGDTGKVSRLGRNLADPENPENFPATIVQDLKGIRAKEEGIVAKVLDQFDENCEDYADSIVRSFVPMDMGSINMNDVETLYGLFVKEDFNGKKFFVHPIAAKYLLYKLARRIETELSMLAPAKSRSKALKGDQKVSFNIEKTRKNETLEEYWSQVGMHISKSEIQHFIRKYKLYNTANAILCKDYEVAILKQKVLTKLNDRLTVLIAEIEKMFRDFPALLERLETEIAENVASTEEDASKTLYVYAREGHKREVYDSLNLDLTGRNHELNRDVIDSIYGKFCSRVRPNVPKNAEYLKESIISAFHDKIISSFTKTIVSECRDLVDLDIISAIYKESDYKYQQDRAPESEDPFAVNNDAEKAMVRHQAAVVEYRNRLSQKAQPFLIAQPDVVVKKSDDGFEPDTDSAVWMTTSDGEKLYMPIQTELTFWGFHPNTVARCPALEANLGANKATAAHERYGENELYCYTSIYGVTASAVSKFRETEGGDYYKHYDAVITNMIARGSDVDSPHLDKTWHEFLPYVSAEKQEEANRKFYQAFWRAVAYGRLVVDHDKFCLIEYRKDAYGNRQPKVVALEENGRPIGKTDITRLVRALRNSSSFESTIVRELEAEYEADLTDMTTYVGTKLLKGLLVDSHLNAVTMTTRYAMSKDCNDDIYSNLIGGFAALMEDVANHYDMIRGEDQIAEAKVRLCHRIYQKSSMKGKNRYLKYTWIKDFQALKLAIDDDGTTDSGDAEGTDII